MSKQRSRIDTLAIKGPADDMELSYRVVAMPRDTNGRGDIFGGWLMSQVDLAAGIPAVRVAGGPCVTVSVDNFQFHRPVAVSDILDCYTRVSRIGSSSINIQVWVFAQKYAKEGYQEFVAEADLKFVRVDNDGKPLKIPASAHSKCKK